MRALSIDLLRPPTVISRRISSQPHGRSTNDPVPIHGFGDLRRDDFRVVVPVGAVLVVEVVCVCKAYRHLFSICTRPFLSHYQGLMMLEMLVIVYIPSSLRVISGTRYIPLLHSLNLLIIPGLFLLLLLVIVGNSLGRRTASRSWKALKRLALLAFRHGRHVVFRVLECGLLKAVSCVLCNRWGASLRLQTFRE